MEDYLVGNALLHAEAVGEELKIVYSLIMTRSGMEVADWLALEAIL